MAPTQRALDRSPQGGLSLTLQDTPLAPHRQRELLATLVAAAREVPVAGAAEPLSRGAEQGLAAVAAALDQDAAVGVECNLQGLLAAAGLLAILRHTLSGLSDVSPQLSRSRLGVPERGSVLGSSSSARKEPTSKPPSALPSPSPSAAPSVGVGALMHVAALSGTLRCKVQQRRDKGKSKESNPTAALRDCASDAADIFEHPGDGSASWLRRFAAAALPQAAEIDQSMRGALQEPTIFHRLVAAAVRGSDGAARLLCRLLRESAGGALGVMHDCGGPQTVRCFEQMFDSRDPLLEWLFTAADFATRSAVGKLMYCTCPGQHSALVEIVRSGNVEARRALAALACRSGDDSGEIAQALKAMVTENDEDHEFEAALKTLCLQNSLQQRSREAQVLLRALVQGAGSYTLQLLAKHIENENEIVWWQLAKLATHPATRAKLQAMPQGAFDKIALSARAIQLLYADPSSSTDGPGGSRQPSAACGIEESPREKRAAWSPHATPESPQRSPRESHTQLEQASSKRAPKLPSWVQPMEQHMLRMEAALAERQRAVPALLRPTIGDQLLEDVDQWEEPSSGGSGWRVVAHLHSPRLRQAASARPHTGSVRGAQKHLSRMGSAVHSREQEAWRRKEAAAQKAEQRRRRRQRDAALASWAKRERKREDTRRAVAAAHRVIAERREEIAAKARAWDQQYELSVAKGRIQEQAVSEPLVVRARSRMLDRLVNHEPVKQVMESGRLPRQNLNKALSSIGNVQHPDMPRRLCSSGLSGDVSWYHAMPTRTSSARFGERTPNRLAVPSPGPELGMGSPIGSLLIGARGMRDASASSRAPSPHSTQVSEAGDSAGSAGSPAGRSSKAADSHQGDTVIAVPPAGEEPLPAVRAPPSPKGREGKADEAHVGRVRRAVAASQPRELPRRCRTAPGARERLSPDEEAGVTHRLYRHRLCPNPDLVKGGYIVGDDYSARFYPREAQKILWDVDGHVDRLVRPPPRPRRLGLPRPLRVFLTSYEIAALGRRLSPSKEAQEQRRHEYHLERANRRFQFQPKRKLLSPEVIDELNERATRPLQQTHAAQPGHDLYYVDHVLYDRRTGERVVLPRSGTGGGGPKAPQKKRLPSVFVAQVDGLPPDSPRPVSPTAPPRSPRAPSDMFKIDWDLMSFVGQHPRDPWWVYQDAPWGGAPPDCGVWHPPYYWGSPNLTMRAQDRVVIAKPLSQANNNRLTIDQYMQFCQKLRRLGLGGVWNSAGWTVRDRKCFYILQGSTPESLFSWLKARRAQGVPAKELLQIAAQLAVTAAQMHKAGIRHRNIALRSCLVAEPNGPTVVLGDAAGPLVFDTMWHACVPEAAQTYALSPALWWPPEFVEQLSSPTDPQVDKDLQVSPSFGNPQDVWCFGVLLWEIFSLGLWLPFTPPGKLPLGLRLARLMAGSPLPRPPGCPRHLWVFLIEPCFAQPSSARPSMQSVSNSIQSILSSDGAAAGGVDLSTIVSAPGGPPSF
eukprot:TRINITY_DN22687_c1_g3_i1.p1 TRINITY_DN22687_c1_g3~~TRINITY_DN22687_c1_g3_i1.p1  ORF type:complete len:1510 (+),score=362.60 TRINITY_DN22687_c1_g3_i1:86-4531(+)